jgi:hypothetical protein
MLNWNFRRCGSSSMPLVWSISKAGQERAGEGRKKARPISFVHRFDETTDRTRLRQHSLARVARM